ncbi:MAG TPA: PadR family transcriptional regulator, partial [Micromonosporaceae bacterium]
MLELAILGLLHESPMHGYELRKQLTTKLGAIRAAISYGSLYPTLRRLQAMHCITESEPDQSGGAAEIPPMTSRRGRVVYKITAEGKERFQELLAQAGPETFDDPGFGVHFA